MLIDTPFMFMLRAKAVILTRRNSKLLSIDVCVSLNSSPAYYSTFWITFSVVSHALWIPVSFMVTQCPEKSV